MNGTAVEFCTTWYKVPGTWSFPWYSQFFPPCVSILGRARSYTPGGLVVITPECY